MATIDRELVRAINSGNCFALVGAGPSCEIGLPPWQKLAENAILLLKADAHQAVIDRCRKLLAQKNYPGVFSAIEKVIGLDVLINNLESAFPRPNSNGAVYSYLAHWPFAVYLTTNYDDCLKLHLKKERLSYVTRHNSQSDFRTLRADSRGVIYKIHGDCSTPNDIVLTLEQYEEFRKSEPRRYWREKIRSVLHMINLVLIGYSVSDPDFKDQLELAKELASPIHPIFMFSADFGQEDIRQYYREYNIRIIPYKNPNGTHRELHRVLKRYDPFIAKRGAPHLGQDPIDEDKANLASSIYLFTRLNLAGGSDTCLKKAYEALIASVLGNYADGERIPLNEIQKTVAKKINTQHLDPIALQEALGSLHSHGYIEISRDRSHYSLSRLGHDKLESVKAERELREEKFRESCRLFLQMEYSALDQSAQDTVIRQITMGLVRAFEKRGAEMAQATFGQNTIDLSTAVDILDVLNIQSTSLHDESSRAAFTDLMLEILVQPTQDMKEKLVDLSQGYFSYHALGIDPSCSDARLQIAKQKAWILDSSIILPLLAKDCINHEFASDLLNKMMAIELRLVTTGRLFDEVIDHAVWAIRSFNGANADSPMLLQVASGGPGYKQNLFIDGYVKWAVQQGAPSLTSYFRATLGDDYDKNPGGCVEERIKELGIKVVEFSDWPDFQQEQWGERKKIEDEIIELRKERGTYRSDEQCRAEAEVLILCEDKKAAFLSQSGILDQIDQAKPRITWKPESMYRFLSTFSTVPPDEDLLYQSMVQDFFYSGFDIINHSSLKQYFTEPVRQARLKLDEEKLNYEQALGSVEYDALRSRFDNVPDIQKPFYSMQFAYYVARKEGEKRKAAERRATRAEKTKKLSVAERREFERLRAKKSEKRQLQKKRTRKLASQKTKPKRRKRG